MIASHSPARACTRPSPHQATAGTHQQAWCVGRIREDGDSGNFRYLHVSDDLKARLQNQRSKLVEKIKAIDPSFVAKEVKAVSRPGCGCQIVAVLVLVLVFVAVLLYLVKLSKG